MPLAIELEHLIVIEQQQNIAKIYVEKNVTHDSWALQDASNSSGKYAWQEVQGHSSILVQCLQTPQLTFSRPAQNMDFFPEYSDFESF